MRTTHGAIALGALAAIGVAAWLGRPASSQEPASIDALAARAGSFFEPVAGERFDLVVSNPPFVVSPGTSERLVYRDSGLPGVDV